MSARRIAVLAALVAACAAGCSQETLGPEAERGRQIYQAQCIVCHNADPAQPGVIGPAVKGASEDLLRAKVLNGAYPAGYAPKRPTKVMQPMPPLANDIPALATYLK